jgi:hypothetical protein
MSRGGVVADLIRQDARQLKMPGAARAFEALGRQAREEKWSFEDYLHEVLSVEIQSRRESAIRQRVQDARFPEMKTLDQFDFKAAEGVDATLIAELARGGECAARRTDRHRQDAPCNRTRYRGCETASTRDVHARSRPRTYAGRSA